MDVVQEKTIYSVVSGKPNHVFTCCERLCVKRCSGCARAHKPHGSLDTGRHQSNCCCRVRLLHFAVHPWRDASRSASAAVGNFGFEVYALGS
jgi:hypothetical protein